MPAFATTVADMHHHRLWLLVAVGVTLGAYLDFTHTHGGEITYPEGTNEWRGVATFGFVYSVPGWIYCVWTVLTGMPTAPAPFRVSVPLTLGMSLLYLTSSYGDEVAGADSTAKLAVIGAAGVAAWLAFDRSWQGFSGACLVAALGCAVEHQLCVVGSMSYTTAELGRVPYWLFAVYFMGTLTWGHCVRRILLCPEQPLVVRRV